MFLVIYNNPDTHTEMNISPAASHKCAASPDTHAPLRRRSDPRRLSTTGPDRTVKSRLERHKRS